METLWLIIYVALDGLRSGFGLPLGIPHTYPQEDGVEYNWGSENGMYMVIPLMVVVLVAMSFIFGCLWCYRHKDCKSEEGNDNQLFSSSNSQVDTTSRRYQPDSGFSEPANNNITEDNNNGPISLREMQNIANNNAEAYIVSENEERNRAASRESVVEFEPLPDVRPVVGPLVPHADWFERENFPRDRLQYLREIGRGWFGRVVQGEIENPDSSITQVAVKILNQNASMEEKAQFLQEARMYRDVWHDNVLAMVASCLREEPWILMFQFYPMTLQQYLVENRPQWPALDASGAPLRLLCDVADALTHLHTQGFTYGCLDSSTILIRGSEESARAVLGRYGDPSSPCQYAWYEDVYSFGAVVWEVCAAGAPPPPPPLPPPPHPCLYREHLYQVTQLCMNPHPESRPSAAQLLALVSHLLTSHRPSRQHDDLTEDFEARWQNLKPNTIPILDEHTAIVHAPQQTLNVDNNVSRSSSVMSDKDNIDTQYKSESLTNLHGSLEDVRNIYLTHNENAAIECHEANSEIEKQDLSDTTVDPWLKDIIAGSMDDVSYYKDVSDVIKNLDNILNSEKTSSSESSHQASPSRDNLTLDCKKEHPVQSSLVKSPGIRNFQNVLDIEDIEEDTCVDEDIDRDTVGSLSHSFERHSDTGSQNTLENLTPETPNKNIESICEETDLNDKPTCNVEMPKVKVVESVVPKLKDLCLVTRSRISEDNVKDCKTTCDRSDNPELVLAKSVVSLSENIPKNEKHVATVLFLENESAKEENCPKESLVHVLCTSTDVKKLVNGSLENHSQSPEEISDVITTSEQLVDEVIATAKLKLSLRDDKISLNNVADIQNDTLPIENGIHKEYIPEILPTSLTAVVLEQYELKEKLAREEKSAYYDSLTSDRLEGEDTSVQITFNTETIKLNDEVTDRSISESFERSLDTTSTMPIGNIPEDVQNIENNAQEPLLTHTESNRHLPTNANESTEYLDLNNTTAIKIKHKDTMSETMKELVSNCYNTTNDATECTLVRNESTAYMDLPTIIQDTTNFIHSERLHNDFHAFFDDDITASTPKNENEKAKQTQESARKIEPVTPDYGPGVTVTKLEQKTVADYMSPCDSPTKSHPTDTYDENSSIVLGSFENCSLELFKTVKSEMDIPKEELLAFSSNFSEMNLETPSPLRDVNFLLEVPDIDGEATKSAEMSKDSLEDKATTEKVKSPSTPPNSPGNFLASTAQKYIAEIDTIQSNEVVAPNQVFIEAIDLDDIELEITSKLAMAENENNLNIEYSGPLVEEPDDVESILAGNGGLRDERDNLGLDEDCMKALRNELELKLPLAQVASIEPAEEPEKLVEAFWAPEVVVNYPGALSPIQEETVRQLSAYDNDMPYNPSTRTDSSESYLEPCNNSTDEVTDLTANPTSAHTYTVDKPSPNNTYTLNKDATNSREITMSADSLNGSPARIPNKTDSPLDDATYNKDDKEPNLERISQVSPLLLSPTTDTSVPSSDNATGISTLSKTTAPTTKPSEVQCLSKATSIDSWCSNDTLFNVEDNFDDLAMEAEAAGFDKDEPSDSTHTLNNEEKDDSHCSTYIIHDDNSDPCDTFSPDSISANGTYTKLKTENKSSPLVVFTKSEVNDSSDVNSQTKDLAYGTLMTGATTHSSCATDVLSMQEDIWRLAQPELVRRSPIADETMNLTPPTNSDITVPKDDSPKLTSEPTLNKMDSVDITCLQDITNETTNLEELVQIVNDTNKSPNFHFRNMASSVQSTPLLEPVAETMVGEDMSPIPIDFPSIVAEPSEGPSVSNFLSFLHSAELRPQDISMLSAKENTDLLLEAERTKSFLERTPNYTSFEGSAIFKPQEVHTSSESNEVTAVSSNEEFRLFENSVRERPQDLSDPDNDNLSKCDGTANFVTYSGIMDSDHSVTPNLQEDIRTFNAEYVSLQESNKREYSSLSTILADEDEQPHSFIFTDDLCNVNHTFNSNANETDINHTYDSHTMRDKKNDSGDAESSRNTPKSPDSSRPANDEVQSSTGDVTGNGMIAGSSETQNHPIPEGKVNGVLQNYATLNVISDNFEELNESGVESIMRESELKKEQSSQIENKPNEVQNESRVDVDNKDRSISQNGQVPSVVATNGNIPVGKIATLTEDFLLNEKRFCQLDAYLPILGDIRFTGPSEEMMTTSFTQDSPTDDLPPNSEGQSPSRDDKKQNGATDIVKEWDSDSDSGGSNSSSGEFIWKDGDGLETPVVPAYFDHQRDGPGNSAPAHRGSGASSAASDSGDSGSDGSGSEGDEAEFVPSSWDCRAEPAKTSLRTVQRDLPNESKKRVMFKRQKYHCVYEYPREAPEVAPPLYNLDTYEYDADLAEAAELSYNQLYGHPLDMYQLRTGVSFGTDYDDDFFISSSARPFESLGMMSSQFFPGKSGPVLEQSSTLLEQPDPDDVSEEFPPPPSPLPHVTTLVQSKTPSLDFTTPDSGVEDITPVSTTTEELKKLPEPDMSQTQCWRSLDSGSSSESISPSSPGGETLGGLRHTRDKLKLDLPPSPCVPSPRHNRVFNFVLDKPKARHRSTDDSTPTAATPLVMTDETPLVTTALPIDKEEEISVQEPTFSTFGKCAQKTDAEQKIILTDQTQSEEEVAKEQSKETVKGEGTVLDSGDEDSGIESSAKASLERKTNVS